MWLHGKAKPRGGTVGYKIFITVLKYLGLPFAYFLLRFVAFYFFRFRPCIFQKHLLSFTGKRLGYKFPEVHHLLFTEIIMFSGR